MFTGTESFQTVVGRHKALFATPLHGEILKFETSFLEEITILGTEDMRKQSAKQRQNNGSRKASVHCLK